MWKFVLKVYIRYTSVLATVRTQSIRAEVTKSSTQHQFMKLRDLVGVKELNLKEQFPSK